MLHLFDGLFAPSLGEVLVAPVIQNAIVQPVLVDCREFVLQRSIEIIDNLFVTPHRLTPHVLSKQRGSPQKSSPASNLRLTPRTWLAPIEQNPSTTGKARRDANGFCRLLPSTRLAATTRPSHIQPSPERDQRRAAK